MHIFTSTWSSTFLQCRQKLLWVLFSSFFIYMGDETSFNILLAIQNYNFTLLWIVSWLVPILLTFLYFSDWYMGVLHASWTLCWWLHAPKCTFSTLSPRHPYDPLDIVSMLIEFTDLCFHNHNSTVLNNNGNRSMLKTNHQENGKWINKLKCTPTVEWCTTVKELKLYTSACTSHKQNTEKRKSEETTGKTSMHTCNTLSNLAASIPLVHDKMIKNSEARFIILFLVCTHTFMLEWSACRTEQ